MARPLRLPEKFAFTALIVAAAACSGHAEGGGDAGSDVVAHDSAADCDGPAITCGGGPCLTQGAVYCGTQCPPGCEPFA